MLRLNVSQLTNINRVWYRTSLYLIKKRSNEIWLNFVICIRRATCCAKTITESCLCIEKRTKCLFNVRHPSCTSFPRFLRRLLAYYAQVPSPHTYICRETQKHRRTRANAVRGTRRPIQPLNLERDNSRNVLLHRLI